MFILVLMVYLFNLRDLAVNSHRYLKKRPILNFLFLLYFIFLTKRIGLYQRKRVLWKWARKETSWLEIFVFCTNTIELNFYFIFYPRQANLLIIFFSYYYWKKNQIINYILNRFFQIFFLNLYFRGFFYLQL